LPNVQNSCSVAPAEVRGTDRSVGDLKDQTADAFSWTILSQVAMVVVGVMVARMFGPAGKGLLNYAGIAIMVATTLAEGISGSVVYLLGQAGRELGAVRRSTWLVIALPAICGTAAYLALAAFFPSQRALVFAGIAFPFALAGSALTGFLLAQHRIREINIANFIAQGGGAILAGAAVFALHLPIDGFMWIWAAAYAASALFLVFRLGRAPRRAFGPAIDPGELRATQLRFALRAGSAALAGFFALRIDVVIVSAAFDAAMLGVYTLALAAGEIMWQLGRSISLASFGRLASADRARAVALTTRTTRLLVTFQAVIAIVLFVVGPRLIELVYGPEFRESGHLLRLLTLGMFFYCVDAPLVYYLNAFEGRPGLVFKIDVTVLFASATCAALLAMHFGILGVIIAMTAGYAVSLSAKLYACVRLSHVPLSRYLIITRDDLGAIAGLFNSRGRRADKRA
jgi:O-antigen/teichoic acid export membrane protein